MKIQGKKLAGRRNSTFKSPGEGISLIVLGIATTVG